MKHIKKHLPFLHLLANTHHKQRQSMIDSSTREQLELLTEIIINLLQQVIPIRDEHQQQLRRHRKVIRQLSRKKVPLQTRKELLFQPKHLIPLIFKPILPILEDMLQ